MSDQRAPGHRVWVPFCVAKSAGDPGTDGAPTVCKACWVDSSPAEAEPRGAKAGVWDGLAGSQEQPHASAGGGCTLQGSPCEHNYARTLPSARSGIAIAGKPQPAGTRRDGAQTLSQTQSSETCHSRPCSFPAQPLLSAWPVFPSEDTRPQSTLTPCLTRAYFSPGSHHPYQETGCSHRAPSGFG